jgi:plasmid stabilization system protein ParE
MKVRWSVSALTNLTAIAEYIATDNPGTAARIAARIEETAQRPRDYPHLGRGLAFPEERELIVSGTPFRDRLHGSW